MHLYDCRLTFHDNLFYETRTLGRLYETAGLLHNIALSYALGFAETSHYHATDMPQYAAELAVLNEARVYVTPAGGDEVRYVVHTFKLGDERSSVMMERSNANIPTYGRAKEVGIGSRFVFGVLSERPLTFPRWIRMGLWMSKARLHVSEPILLHRVDGVREEMVDLYPLNPSDLPPTATLRLFDLVSMRPTSLVENALIAADSWWVGEHPQRGRFSLPVGLSYRVNN